MNVSNISTLVSSIDGNSQKLDGGAMFGNAPKAMWQQWVAVDELNRIELATRGLLIETAGKKILCEVGIGNFFEPEIGKRFGVNDLHENILLKNLKSNGLTHEDIDIVILSHLHFDHAGGLLPSYAEQRNGNNNLLFPNAKYVVSKEAFERSFDPHPRDRASYIPGLGEKLLQSGRLFQVEGENYKNIVPDNFSFIVASGHTPGQLHTLVQGEKEKIFFCGDTIPGLAWLHVAITMGYDCFAEMVIDEKTKILQCAVNEHWLLFFTHDVKAVAANCIKNEKGKFVSKNEISSLKQRIL